MKASELIYGVTQASGVFGRNKEVTVHFEGDGAYTDGKEIVLPAIDQRVEYTHEDVMVMRGYIDHEAGHVRHTNFDDWKKFRETNTEACGSLCNALEDVWLENKVIREYPGAEKNLRANWNRLIEGETKPIDYSKLTYESALSAILTAGYLPYGGEKNKANFEAMPKQFQEWGLKWAELARNNTETKNNCNLAIEIEKLIQQEEQEQKEKGKSKLDGNPEDFEFDPNGDITQGNPRKTEGQRAKEAKEGKGKPVNSVDQNESMKDWMRSKEDGYIKDHKMQKGKQYKVLTTRYDEVYTRNSVNSRQHEVHKEMSKAQVSDYEKTKSKLSGNVHAMKTKLRRALLALERRDWDYGRELGKLDSKRLVAGRLGAPNVYKQRQDREEYDTAVHVLVDLSGSMGGEKIKTAQESVVALCECLEGTQIKYQVTGFSNQFYLPDECKKLTREADKNKSSYARIEPLNLFVFKPFNESLQVNKGAVWSIKEAAGGDNSDYDAVLWAAEELKAMPNKRKVLIVLSDGQPAYTYINYREEYQRQALKDLVLDLEKSMEVVGIGILDTAVKQYYTKSVSIKSVNDLSGTIFNQLSNILVGGKVRF